MAINPENDVGSELDPTDELPVLTAAELEALSDVSGKDLEDTDQHLLPGADSFQDQRINALQADLAEREAQIEALDAELEQAWIAVVQLNRRWTDVEPRLNERDQTVAALTKQVAELEHERERLQVDISAQQARIEGLERAAEAETIRAGLVQEQQRTIDELSGATARQQEKLATLEHYVDNRQAHWRELEQADNAKQERIRELEYELLERVRRIEQAETRARHTESELGTLRQRLVEARLATQSQQQSATAAGERMAVLDAEVTQWREQTRTLRTELADKDHQLSEHRQTLEQRDGELAVQTRLTQERDEKIAELARQLQRTEQLQGAAEQQLSDRDAQLAALQDDLQQAAQAQAAAEQQLSDRDAQLAALQDDLQQAAQAQGAAEQQLTEGRQAIHDLEQRLSQSSESINALQAENEQLRAALDETAQALSAAEGKITALSQALVDQEQELHQVRQSAADSEGALKDSQRAAAEGEAVRAEQLEQIARLEEQLTVSSGSAEELSRLQQQLERADAQARAAEEDKQILEEALQQQEIQLDELRQSQSALIREVTEFEVNRERRELLIEELQSQVRDKDKQLADSRGRRTRLSAIEDSLLDLDSRMSKHINSVVEQDEHGQARLLVDVTGGREIRYPLYKDAVTLGRTADNDIQLPTSYVSRHHARLVREGDNTFIEDLQSTNGVYVNARRVSKTRLENGDEITIGRTAFHYRTTRQRGLPAARPVEEAHPGYD